jgi:ribosomal protein S27AE
MQRNREKLLAYKHSYNISEKGKEIQAAAKRKFRAKANARSLVFQAVRDGTLIKPDVCQECGRQVLLNGHHEDYSKPRDVVWLCVRCHHRLHRKVHV